MIDGVADDWTVDDLAAYFGISTDPNRYEGGYDPAYRILWALKNDNEVHMYKSLDELEDFLSQTSPILQARIQYEKGVIEVSLADIPQEYQNKITRNSGLTNEKVLLHTSDFAFAQRWRDWKAGIAPTSSLSTSLTIDPNQGKMGWGDTSWDHRLPDMVNVSPKTWMFLQLNSVLAGDENADPNGMFAMDALVNTAMTGLKCAAMSLSAMVPSSGMNYSLSPKSTDVALLLERNTQAINAQRSRGLVQLKVLKYLSQSGQSGIRIGGNWGGQASAIASLQGAMKTGGATGAVGNLPSGPLRFSQVTASQMFQAEGNFGGKAISDIAYDLRRGTMSAKDVPVEYLVRDGNRLIINTRSSLALRQAGISESQWTLVDMTGNINAEARMTQRLLKNNLTSAGTSTLRITGMRVTDTGVQASTLVTQPARAP